MLSYDTYRCSVIALQVPFLIFAAVKAAECAILVWCLLSVCVVKTPVWWLAAPPPPPLPLLPPPDGSPPPPTNLASVLRLCAMQYDPTYRTADMQAVTVGATLCLEQVVPDLPPGAALVNHALYGNGTLLSLTPGAQHIIWREGWRCRRRLGGASLRLRINARIALITHPSRSTRKLGWCSTKRACTSFACATR
jgi:hypothetical protein